MKLLDNHFEQLTNQINGLKPTSVPEEYKNSYRYMIWLQECNKKENFVVGHLVLHNNNRILCAL